jgi:HSP20 family molecular chaperone IbpA
MTDKTQLAERGDKAMARQTNGGALRKAAIVPAVDIYEDSHGITLWADLPGVSRDRLEVRVQDGNLIIEGEVAVATPAELRLQHAEMHEPRFARAFALGADFDPSKIDANLTDGVLKLSIPRRDEARPRRIEVSVG